MSLFEQCYNAWLEKQIAEETNPRRLELLRRELGYGTIAFLRYIWFPAVGNFDYLYAEWEVRDFNNGYRYLDLVYIPGNVKACIEIHGYRSHARDVEAGRFKDLCMKQALLVLADWAFLPVAYLSIKEDPELCKKLVLAFIGKFLNTTEATSLNWAESETMRFGRRLMRPFSPIELEAHLKISDRHIRRTLHSLVDKRKLTVVGGKQRYRSYILADLAEVVPAVASAAAPPIAGVRSYEL